LVNLK
jgi:hypothetical protein